MEDLTIILSEILEELRKKNDDKVLLTPKETAEVLGVDYCTCLKVMKRKSFPKIWNGSRMMTNKSKLQEWLDSNKELTI